MKEQFATSSVTTLDRDQLIERVEAYFKRVRKLGGETGECSAPGFADFLMYRAETKNFAPAVAVPSAIAHNGDDDWIWSLDQPETSGQCWIETWDESAMVLGVMRFTAGDVLPKNIACWRYTFPPKGRR